VGTITAKDTAESLENIEFQGFFVAQDIILTHSTQFSKYHR